MSIFFKITRTLGAALLLFVASPALHAVVDVGYKQDEPGEVRTTTNDDGSTTTTTTTGGSFIVDTNYALIINPNDAEGYQGVTHSNTKAYRIMTYLFGTMDRSQYGGIICAPPNPCSALMGNLFSILNSGILTLGMIFLGYTITNSAFSDAAQGTALGQKFSPQEVALRSAIGLGFLLPTSTGYSVIQIAIVKLILLGSSAGTGLWQYLVDYRYAANEAIGSAHLYDGQDMAALGGEKAAEDFISQFADIETCVLYQNHSITNPDNWVVSELYTDATGNTSVRTGSPQSEDGSYNNICGQMTIGQLGNSEYDIVVQYISQVRTIASLMVQDYFAAPEGAIDDVTLYQNQYFILKDMMRLDLELLTLADKKKEASENEFNTDISQSEWLDIPGYFFQFLTTPGHDVSVDFNSSMLVEPNFTYSSSALHSYYSEATNWSGSGADSDWRQQADQSNRTNMSIDFGTLNMLKADASYEVTKNLKEMFESVTRYQDPLVGLAAYGRQWLEVAMQVMIAAYVFSLLVAVATGIASDYVGMSQMGIGMAVVGLISAVLQAFGAIIPIASMFAIGLPMMPLILFSSAIIAWVIYTIAAVMSGPIIAIGLISPGGGLGKAAPAMMLLLNLFLRPSLHVIGLVAGAKLFNIAFIYFTQAFLTTVYQIFEITSLPSDGMLMSLTSIIFLYAYTFAISALCSRCYSLITAIPDKVFTWVGGAPMGLPDPVAQASRTALQRSASHAEQKAGEMSKGIDEFVNQKFKEANKKIKKRQEDGKKARSFTEDMQSFGARTLDGLTRAGDALQNFDMRGAVNNIRQGAARGVHNARNFFGGSTQEARDVAGAQRAVDRAERQLGRATRIGEFFAAIGATALGMKAPDISAAEGALTKLKETRDAAEQKYQQTAHYKVRAELAQATSESQQARHQFEAAKKAFLATGQSLENMMTIRSSFDDINATRATINLRNAYRSVVTAQLEEQKAIANFTRQLAAEPIRMDGKVSAAFNDAGTYHKRSMSMLVEIETTLKNAKLMGASAESITRLQELKSNAAQTHTELRGVLAQNMSSLSGINQLRLGLGERFDNITKTTKDPDAEAAKNRPSTDTRKLQTFEFHKDPKKAGIVSSFVSRNYNRGMGRLTAYAEEKYISIKDKLGYSNTLQKSYSQGYFARAKIAEQHFTENYDPSKLTFTQRVMLRHAEVGFNVLGSWKSVVPFTQKMTFRDSDGKFALTNMFQGTLEDKHSYSKNDPSINGIMRRDYAPTHNFEQLLRPSEQEAHAGPHNTAAPLTKAQAQAQEEKLKKDTQKAELAAQKEEARAARLENAYQGKERRALRDARENFVDIRNSLLAKNMSYAEIKKQPEFIQAITELKKAEAAIDGKNFIATGLRALDRGVKEGSRSLGSWSRQGLADLRATWKDANTTTWSGVAIKAGLGVAIPILTVGDTAFRLSATLAFKVPGAFFRPNHKTHMQYSDRSIFSLEQISHDKNSYNQWGISTDQQSVAQSFRDLAEVMTLGMYSSRTNIMPEDSAQPALSAPITAQVGQNEEPRISSLTDTYSERSTDGSMRDSESSLDLLELSEIRMTITDSKFFVDENGVAYSHSEFLQSEEGKLPANDSYGQDNELRVTITEAGSLKMDASSGQDVESLRGAESSKSDASSDGDTSI